MAGVVRMTIIAKIKRTLQIWVDGNTQKEFKLETEKSLLESDLRSFKDEIDELNEIIEGMHEQLSAELFTGDFVSDIKGDGTVLFRSKDLEFSPSNWIGFHDILLSPSQGYIRQPNLRKLTIENTNSMLPCLDGGHHILVLPKEHWKHNLKVGDIVVWKKEGKIQKVCHRVVKIHPKGDKVITQGDNVKSNDGWITMDEIESVVVAVVY